MDKNFKTLNSDSPNYYSTKYLNCDPVCSPIQKNSPIKKFIGVPIKNESGEQNCFVNVILHFIYNIKEIKNYFLKQNFPDDKRFYLFSELKVKIALII